jgi:hypothetical protein
VIELDHSEFDVTITGFEVEEVDLILEEGHQNSRSSR